MSAVPPTQDTPWWASFFSPDQIGSYVRIILASGGPLAGWLISVGFTRAQLDTFSTGLATFMATIIPIIISFILSRNRHTVVGNTMSVAGIPGATVVVNQQQPGVPPELVALANDKTRATENIIMKTPPPNPTATMKKELKS